MKRCVTSFVLFFALIFSPVAYAQEEEIQQLLLDVEKLAQLKTILTDLKQGYAIISGGYQAIKNISEGNFKLHQQFLDGLLRVSPVVKTYRPVASIIQTQIVLVKAYQAAFRRFKVSGRFRPEEIAYLSRVYTHLTARSAHNLEALAMVITAGKLRMSDAERLDAIDAIWAEARNEQSFLRQFNNTTQLLAVQRAKEAADLKTANMLYGISR